MADIDLLDLTGRKGLEGADEGTWGKKINDYIEDSTTQPTIVGKINEVTMAVNVINGSATGLNSKLDKDGYAGTAQDLKDDIDLKAPINNPTFTGTVNGITQTMVGLGNVTNESKSTMFTNPVFTGNPTTTTPSLDDSDTSVVNSQWVRTYTESNLQTTDKLISGAINEVNSIVRSNTTDELISLVYMHDQINDYNLIIRNMNMNKFYDSIFAVQPDVLYDSAGNILFENAINPIIAGGNEVSRIINADGSVNAWYGNPGLYIKKSEDGINDYKYLQNTSIDTPLDGNIRFHCIIKHKDIFYMMAKKSTEDSGMFIWSSTNGISWGIRNNGLPILTTGTGIYSYIWNPTFCIDNNDVCYMYLECDSVISQASVGLAYFSFDFNNIINNITIDLNPTKIATHMIPGGGNANVLFLPDKNALLILHGTINLYTAWWDIIATKVSLASSLINPVNYTKAPYFKITYPNMHSADPDLLCIPNSKKTTLDVSATELINKLLLEIDNLKKILSVDSINIGEITYGIAYNPKMNKLYVSTATKVYVVNLTTKKAITNITVGTNARGIKYCSVGNKIYVCNYSSSNISVINCDTDTVVSTIAVTGNPVGIFYDSSRNLMYVTCVTSNKIYVIDCMTNTVSTNFSTGLNPSGIYCANNKIVCCNSNSNTISIFNANTYALISSVSVGTEPVGIAFDSKRNVFYIINKTSGNVSVVSATTNLVTRTLGCYVGIRTAIYDLTSDCLFIGDSTNNTIWKFDCLDNYTLYEFSKNTNLPINMDVINSFLFIANEGSNFIEITTI